MYLVCTQYVSVLNIFIKAAQIAYLRQTADYLAAYLRQTADYLAAAHTRYIHMTSSSTIIMP